MSKEAAKAVPPPPALDPKIEAAIEQWFADNFHGSPVARDTAAYNVVHAAKEDLKQRLAKF